MMDVDKVAEKGLCMINAQGRQYLKFCGWDKHNIYDPEWYYPDDTLFFYETSKSRYGYEPYGEPFIHVKTDHGGCALPARCFDVVGQKARKPD